MNKRYLVFIYVLLASQSMFAQGIMSSMYCWLLGNQDVRQEYAMLTRQALLTLGVHDPHQVSIKQMNDVGPSFVRTHLTSFTAYGIWLDEAHLDTCSPEERLFHIYHEAAHYAHKHHQKLIVGAAVCAPLVCTAMLMFTNLMGVDEKQKYLILAAQTIIAMAAACSYILPEVVKMQEKEADITGAHALINEDKTNVVLAYINLLKSYVSTHTELWWPTVSEQIAYLEALVS